MEGNVSETLILQAFTPVAILLISWTFRIQDPNKRLAMIVLMISTGVALASHGEMKFNLFGFLIQAAAVAVRIDHYLTFLKGQIWLSPSSKLHVW